jgi:hypothetical protein
MGLQREGEATLDKKPESSGAGKCEEAAMRYLWTRKEIKDWHCKIASAAIAKEHVDTTETEAT